MHATKRATNAIARPIADIIVVITEGESASEMSRKLRQYLQDPDLMFRRFRYKTGEDADGNPIYEKKWKKKVRDDNGKVRWIDYDKDSYEVGKGMYKSAYKNAMRVARTETNMAYRKADNVRWQQMDFVTGQRISLSKKHPCEDICDDLAGDYPKSFVFTGWHPQCFCYVTPILGDEDEMAKITDAFLEGKDYEPQFEQLEEYPKGFEKWVKDHKKQIEKSIKQGKEPYFVKDNRKVIEGIIDSKRAKINNASLQGNNSNKYRGTGAKRIINQIPDAVSRSLISKQYSKLTTHLEVAEKLKNNLSVQFGHNVNVTIIPENIKLELAKIYATELSNLSKQYKLTQGKLTDIIIGYLPDDANEYGTTNINARTKNKTLYLRGEIVSRHSKYAIGNSRCDKRKIAQSLVTHEFGHLIYQFKPQTSGSGLLFRASIEKKYNDYLDVSRKLIHDQRINDFAEISLGIKAHSGGIDEFFAEAFQEYKNCRCPSKYAIAVGEIIEKFFGI